MLCEENERNMRKYARVVTKDFVFYNCHERNKKNTFDIIQYAYISHQMFNSLRSISIILGYNKSNILNYTCNKSSFLRKLFLHIRHFIFANAFFASFMLHTQQSFIFKVVFHNPSHYSHYPHLHIIRQLPKSVTLSVIRIMCYSM